MSEARRLPALTRAMAWGAAIMFWVVQLSLWWMVGMELPDSILLSLLLVAVPAFSLAQLPLIQSAEVERVPAYWSSIATLWVIGTACWLVGGREDGPAALGLVRLGATQLTAWTLGLTVAGLLTIFAFRHIGTAIGAQESPMLRQLMPRTREERRLFAVLSVAAGIAEELAYRGYAILVLAPTLGAWGALALTSVVFGVLHGYQGVLGTVRTGLMGAMLGWGFLASGSLWPGILAHTLIDLLAGLVLAERLLPPEPPAGVSHRPSVPPSTFDHT